VSAATGRPLALEDLSGPQKCAVLCIALGPESSSRLLRQLSSAEAEQVGREIASLPVVPQALVQAVLDDFQRAASAPPAGARGGPAVARKMLGAVIGADAAERALARPVTDTDPARRRLEEAAPEVLHGSLRDEHPQTLALILSHLEPAAAARLLARLGPELGAETLTRMARLERVEPGMLALVEATLGRRLGTTSDAHACGGPGAVANLLNLAGRAIESPILEAMAAGAAEIAESVKAAMFTFEDLRLVDAKSLQKVLREVDMKELALAIKGASPEIKRHLRTGMSERAGQALDEEAEMIGAVRIKEVQAAQGRVLEVVRRLEGEGEIVIQGRAGGGGDELVA